MALQMFQTTVGTDPQLAVNNQTGKYYYIKRNGVTVMVSRNVMYIASEIFGKDISIDIELPAHPAFFLHCIGQDGDKNILIGKDARLTVTLPANFQIQAVCPL